MRRSVAFACLLALSSVALAQPFPSRPIELVVHTSPGGGTDQVARLTAEILTREKLMTVPINVSNKPGGGGAIAYTYMKGKRGDPHSIMTVATLALLTQTLRPELDLGLEHFTPLAFLAQDPQAVIVAANSPYKTLKDLLEAARREPGVLSVAVASAGGSARLLAWLIEKETGTRYRPVIFKSGSDSVLQVLGGHTHFTTENISEGQSAVEAKQLRVLAVTSAQRLPIVPDAPTMRELGYDIHIGTGRGFAMAAGVPKEAAARREAILERVYKSAAWREHAERALYESIWLGSADYTKHLLQRQAQHREFLTAVGIIQKQ